LLMQGPRRVVLGSIEMKTNGYTSQIVESGSKNCAKLSIRFSESESSSELEIWLSTTHSSVHLLPTAAKSFANPSIGLGAMGYAMASNVRKKAPADAILYINDINISVCERFKSGHSGYGPIEIVSTAREAVEHASYVISIVPGADDVWKVYLDKTGGVIASKKDPERVLCECSTIDVKSTRIVGGALMRQGLGTYVDTPVSVSHDLPIVLIW
jgi:hypothetical protein